MKQYPDPEKFLEQHLEQAAEKRIRGMKQAGLRPASINGTKNNAKEFALQLEVLDPFSTPIRVVVDTKTTFRRKR